jgi:hypothetical protein
MNENIDELIKRAQDVVDYLDIDEVDVVDILDALASSGYVLVPATDDTPSTAMLKVLMGN